MHRLVLLLTPFMAVPYAIAQNYLGDTRTAIIDLVRGSSDSIYSAMIDSSTDVLRTTFTGPQTITSEFHFQKEWIWQQECDSIVHRFSCGPCFDRDVDKVLADPYGHWLKMEDGRYVRAEKAFKEKAKGDKEWMTYSEMLTIIHSNGQEICGTMVFSYLPLPAKTRKTLVKDLMCSGMYYPFADE